MILSTSRISLSVKYMDTERINFLLYIITSILSKYLIMIIVFDGTVIAPPSYMDLAVYWPREKLIILNKFKY